MKILVCVALRQYGEALFIAQSLQSPFASSVGASSTDALSRVHDALRAQLELTHPIELARLRAPVSVRLERYMAPLLRAEPSVSDAPLEIPLDVARLMMPGGFEELQSPVWRAATWAFHDEDAPEQEPEEGDVVDASPEIEDLAQRLRSWSGAHGPHRPTPLATTLHAIPVSFTPLDLSRIKPDSLWQRSFIPDDLVPAADQPARIPPILDAVAQRWSHLSAEEASARGIEPAFGLDERARELAALIAGERPVPVVLIGPPRVGKTSLVKHLARSLAGEDRRLWFAPAPRLCATDPMSEGWQQQCKDFTAALEARQDILYMGRLVEALDAGKFFGSDYNLAQLLKPQLADRRLRLVAEASPEEWSLIERRDIGFARAFQVIRMEDPSDDAALAIVHQAAARIADREGLTLSADAISRAWSLQRRFATTGSLLGRTIDFITRTLRQSSSRGGAAVQEIDIVLAFCQDTGLPPFLLLDERALDLNAVRAQLTARVMGQQEAVRRVADIISITKAGLAASDRPLGSFLFVGPTGVGKTELAKALADFLFGVEERRLVRLDMSEYANPDAYARLIGEGRADGDLTGPVRRQPFCVVLLDEIEKAHSTVFDLLLQVLGEARLTDVQGRTTRFQNAIVIMTSNLGVETIRPAIGFGGADATAALDAHFRREAERFFRPEFLARIDQFIPFRQLTPEVVSSITQRELDQLRGREGLQRQDVELVISPPVVPWLAARGFDRQYGARPLKRVIDREIAWPLAARLAASQPDRLAGRARRVHIELSATLPVEQAQLVWRVEALDPEDAQHARQSLLAHIERVAVLRRRLQSYQDTHIIDDLAWEVAHFDAYAQEQVFWTEPGAAEMAIRAQQARRILAPLESLLAELSAIEDLAHEAYYSRASAIGEDIAERLAELEPQISALSLQILSADHLNPDEIALVLLAKKPPEQALRNQLLRWYTQRAAHRGWTCSVWRFAPDPEAPGEVRWLPLEAGREPVGADPFILRVHGPAARPLMLPEDGLHRLVAQDGNAVVEIVAVPEDVPWPSADELSRGSANPPLARVWNRRTQEISVPFFRSVDFDPRDPWLLLEPLMEEVAWAQMQYGIEEW
jgi:ATP-dependent Clp protease ATP-binding subunit ClpC